MEERSESFLLRSSLMPLPVRHSESSLNSFLTFHYTAALCSHTRDRELDFGIALCGIS